LRVNRPAAGGGEEEGASERWRGEQKGQAQGVRDVWGDRFVNSDQTDLKVQTC